MPNNDIVTLLGDAQVFVARVAMFLDPQDEDPERNYDDLLADAYVLGTRLSDALSQMNPEQN